MFLLPRLQTLSIVLAVLLATHLAAFSAGWFKGAASERAVWEIERAAVLQRAAAEAERLRATGDRLAAELEIAKATIRTEYVDRIVTVRETASATTRCLTPRTVAVLNRAEPAMSDRLNRESVIRERVDRQGTPPAVIEHRSEVPLEEGGTSELAAAQWIAGAQQAHAECRAQVGALVAWVKAVVARGGA